MLRDIIPKIYNYEASSPNNKSEMIFESLQLNDGKVIADIGSGGGYFTIAFARKVGNIGMVYAVDSKQCYLDFVMKKAEKENLMNIVTVKAKNNLSPLPENKFDLIFVRNVFHHLKNPENYFRNLKKALKPDGTIAIIDHIPARKFDFINVFKHFTPVEKIFETMEKAGYQLLASYNFLQTQTFTAWSCIKNE